MGLKATLTKSEFDALPADSQLRGFYVEENGTYVLDADIEGHPRTAGMKATMLKERDKATAADKEIKRLKDQMGDLDPEKAKAALARIQELEDKQLLDAGKVDDLIKAKTERMQADHNSQIATFKTQLDDEKGKLTRAQRRVRTLVLTTAIQNEAARVGVKPEHLDDVTWRLTERGLDGGIRFDLQEDEQHPDSLPTVVALQGDQVKYGRDATKPMSIEEGLGMLREKMPGFFLPSSGSGAPQGGGARQVGNGLVISADDAKDHGKYARAREQAAKQGVELTIA